MTDPRAALFTWTNGEVVLLGDRTHEGVAVARGWRHADRLTDIRRWRFPDARAAAGQVRRLVRDASGDDHLAAAAMNAFLQWHAAPAPVETTSA